MAVMDKKMTSMLYRALCPSPTELGEYELKMLSGKQARIVEAHLLICPHCRQELNTLRTYLKDLSPDLEFSFVERVKVWVATLLPGRGEGGGALDLAFGLRGDPGNVSSYQAGDALLTLEVQPDPAQPERKALLGLVTGVDTSGMSAALWREGERIAESNLDELGNLMFQELESGVYDLILHGPEVEIHVHDVSV